MSNETFAKLLKHDFVKDVPLVYIIKVFSAIQDIKEKEKEEQALLDIS